MADAPDEVVEALHAEWLAHVRPEGVLAEVNRAARQVAESQHRLTQAVQAARSAQVSWSQIGAAAGMSRQSAHERWGQQRLVEQPDPRAKWRQLPQNPPRPSG